MTTATWIILGATSAIAEAFAHRAAQAGHQLILVARDAAQLEVIAADLQLRYHITCRTIHCNFAEDISHVLAILNKTTQAFYLFIAQSDIVENTALTPEAIEKSVQINIVSVSVLIHTYLSKPQTAHRLIFLSSVAACRGRAKNSFYGGSKAAIETYLQGLQQSATPAQHITIVRLGFIDTKQTFGMPGVFYASPPKACARACWEGSMKGKRQLYHPFFWRYIMIIITYLPFFVYRRMGKL